MNPSRMSDLEHQRHKPFSPLKRPRELIVAVPAMRSNVNLSRIVRVAACCGVQKMIACGNPKVDPKIARDGAATVELIVRRSLAPALQPYKSEGYQLVALEQTTGSQNLHQFSFARRTLLIIGHERLGVDPETLRLVDAAVEIPVYGRPYSYNAATAAAMALYEYCRQFPEG